MTSHVGDYQVIIKPIIYKDLKKKPKLTELGRDEMGDSITNLTHEEKKERNFRFQYKKKKELINKEIDMILEDPFYQSKLI